MIFRSRKFKIYLKELCVFAMLCCLLNVVPGCFLLSPDSPSKNVSVRIVASLEMNEILSLSKGMAKRRQMEEQKPNRQPNSDPCRCPEDFLLEGERLSAQASVWLEPAEGTSSILLSKSTLQIVGLGGRSDSLLLEGNIDFPRGGPSDRYKIVAELLVQGQTLEGTYTGKIALQSGLMAAIDTLVIGDSASSTVVVVSSGGKQSVRKTLDCNNIPEGIAPGMFYGCYNDSVSISGAPLREIEVVITASLDPTVIFSGSISVAVEDLQNDIPLVLESVSVPGLKGEKMKGAVRVGFTDGLPPEATGVLSLTRDISNCSLENVRCPGKSRKY